MFYLRRSLLDTKRRLNLNLGIFFVFHHDTRLVVETQPPDLLRYNITLTVTVETADRPKVSTLRLDDGFVVIG